MPLVARTAASKTFPSTSCAFDYLEDVAPLFPWKRTLSSMIKNMLCGSVDAKLKQISSGELTFLIFVEMGTKALSGKGSGLPYPPSFSC